MKPHAMCMGRCIPWAWKWEEDHVAFAIVRAWGARDVGAVYGLCCSLASHGEQRENGATIGSSLSFGSFLHS